MRPLLELLRDGAEHGIRDAYVQLADRFALSESDRQELIPSGTQQLLHNRVGWAKTYLLKSGLFESPRRAVVQITDRGRQACIGSAESTAGFSGSFRSSSSSSVAASGKDPKVEKGSAVPPPVSPERTPEELIEAGYRQVQNALASDLLDRVKGHPPHSSSV